MRPCLHQIESSYHLRPHGVKHNISQYSTWVLRISACSILRNAPYNSCKEYLLSQELGNYTLYRGHQVLKELIVNYTWSTSLFSKFGKVFSSTQISLDIIRIVIHTIILWSITVSSQTAHVEFQLLPLIQFMLNNVGAFTISVLWLH